jgi:hypothetical protein
MKIQRCQQKKNTTKSDRHEARNNGSGSGSSNGSKQQREKQKRRDNDERSAKS